MFVFRFSMKCFLQCYISLTFLSSYIFKYVGPKRVCLCVLFKVLHFYTYLIPTFKFWKSLWKNNLCLLISGHNNSGGICFFQHKILKLIFIFLLFKSGKREDTLYRKLSDTQSFINMFSHSLVWKTWAHFPRRPRGGNKKCLDVLAYMI